MDASLPASGTRTAPAYGWRFYLVLFVAALALMAAAAILIPAPGYMDAEYYYATALQLVQGRGFSEPFVWNFLADPPAIPATSHTYWQPLATLTIAAVMGILGSGFRAAQVAGVLLAAAIPLLSARLAVILGEGRRMVVLAGILGMLPGFFAPYLVTTDTFALYAFIGGVLWWQLGVLRQHPSPGRWMLLGVLVGLGSLTRADGLLLWLPVIFVLLRSPEGKGRALAFSFAGFLALMAPWWLRNLAVGGGLVGGGATRALWLLDYDELFLYPASPLTFARWLAAGPTALFQPRLEAVWTNLQSALAVNGYVFLLPFMLAGGWVHRREQIVRSAALYAIVLFLFMSFVFPFAGSRGGFFHSTAALMPLLYALAAAGLETAGRWIAPRLGWDPGRTRALLAAIAVSLAAALSVWPLLGKAGVLGPQGSFARNQEAYRAVAELLDEDARVDTVLAVGNPPALFLATGSRTVALPHGSETTLRQVVSKYGVDWVILESDHPDGLDALYDSPSGREWLDAPLRVDDPVGRPVYLYRVLPGSGS